MTRAHTHTFEGIVLTYRGRALLFLGNYWEGPLWLPLSQLEVVEENPMAHIVKLRGWLAHKKGLAEFTYYSQTDIDHIAGES